MHVTDAEAWSQRGDGRPVHPAVVQAAEAAMKTGVSKKLSYMKRTQRVSLGFLADYCNDEGVEVVGTDSDKNKSDLLTKALDHEKHWVCCGSLGMG